jgi:hypothetical protein
MTVKRSVPSTVETTAYSLVDLSVDPKVRSLASEKAAQTALKWAELKAVPRVAPLVRRTVEPTAVMLGRHLAAWSEWMTVMQTVMKTAVSWVRRSAGDLVAVSAARMAAWSDDSMAATMVESTVALMVELTEP